MAEELALLAELGEDYLPRGAANHQALVRLILQRSDQFAREHPVTACDILLLLDSSGSMNEPFSIGLPAITKREGVKQAACKMATALGAQDRVTVAFFATQEHLVAEDLSDPRAIQAAIERIDDPSFSGQTNFGAAFTRARMWARSRQQKQSSRKIIFLTDGQDTVQGSFEKALALNAELAKEGVTVDCLGVGGDFAFDAMQQLSGPSNGRTKLLDTPDAGVAAFRELLQAAQRSLIQNVMLRLHLPPGLRDVELFQYTPEVRWVPAPRPNPDGSLDQMFNVGSLSQHHQHIFLLAARLDLPQRGSAATMCQCRVDYRIPVLGGQPGFQETSVQVHVVDDDASRECDGSVRRLYEEVRLAHLEADFKSTRPSQWEDRVKILGAMLHIAERNGLNAKVGDYRRLADKLQRDHNLSQDDLNRLFRRTSTATQDGYIQGNDGPDPALRRSR